VKFEYDFIPASVRDWEMVKAALLNETGWTCHYCECRLRWRRSSIDHQIPRVQGGTNHYANLVICCQSCNSRKGGRTVAQWEGEDE
jgi:5-methylcytosine-specific restriction endonuclease McrA